MGVIGDVTSNAYRIGAVSKLTGISPDSLRIWERRYEAVVPQRTPSGGRLYSAEDVARLRLMKMLVDAGDSIGTVAMLSHEDLEARAERARPVAAPMVSEGPCRVSIVGDALALKVESARDTLREIELVTRFKNLEDFRSAVADTDADMVIIDQPTLQDEAVVEISDLLARSDARHAVILYRFTTQGALQRLPQARCSALRAPVDVWSLERYCASVMGSRAGIEVSEEEQSLFTAEAAPPRRYTYEALARLATLSSTVKCECPRHLAELITSLSAFESYSAECESRSPKDAALHAYLNATASRARNLIETALDQALEADNIKL